jgi:hypothetical protein
VLEVHAVDRPDQRRREQDRRPRRDPLDLLVLGDRDLAERLGLERQVHAQDVLEELAEAVDLLLDPERVVLDVAQVAALLLVDVRVADQVREHARQGLRRPLEQDHLPRELVDAPRHALVPAEDLVLDLVDVVLEPRDDRGVVVDHPVHDRVEHRDRAAPQQVGPRLERLPDARQVGGPVVAHRDDEVGPREDVQLAELDGLGLVDVAGGAQHAEQGLAVPLQLRPLVRVDGVLDRQLVKPELVGQARELLLGGGDEPDPRDAARAPARVAEGGGVCGRLDGHAVAVDGAADDHAPTLPRSGARRNPQARRAPPAGRAARAPWRSAPSVRSRRPSRCSR